LVLFNLIPGEQAGLKRFDTVLALDKENTLYSE
jgi:hypothetical protein